MDGTNANKLTSRIYVYKSSPLSTLPRVIKGFTTEFEVFTVWYGIEILYHTVNTWNEVINPFLPR